MTCEVCGAPVSVFTNSVCTVNDGPEHHHQSRLCETCARKKWPGFIPSLVPGFRKLIEFMKINNRMPSPGELDSKSAADRECQSDCCSATQTMAFEPQPEPGTREFQILLGWLETTADFIDCHGRLPTVEELPEQFTEDRFHQ
jgi:hypothetical protein